MDKYEKIRLEKKLITLIYGDSSDDSSGLSIVQLREKKDEFPGEYDSRKSELTQIVWEYEDCLYGEEDVGEIVFDEILKFIKYLWDKFVPDATKEMKETIGYIRTSLSHAINRYRLYDNTESIEYSNPSYTGNKIDTKEVVESYTPVEQDHELPLRRLYSEIQKQFDRCQDRSGKNTKQYLSSLITFRLIKEEQRAGKLDMLCFDVMKEYRFCDIYVLDECRNAYEKGVKLPKQKEIASRYVRGSTGNERKGDDAARYLKPFVKIIKDSCSI